MTPPTPEAAPRYVSTAQAAGALGVSVTTVKRWVDGGVLPAHRTAGRHRKLLYADLLRLVREGDLPRADLGRLVPRSGADPDAVRRQVLAAARACRLDEIAPLLRGAHQSGVSFAALADEVLAPVLREVGHEWQAGRFEVLHEHRLTQAFVGAAFGIADRLRDGGGGARPVAVGGAPEHDYYTLPTLLAGLTLLDAGWDAVDLGPHTPLSAFHAALDDLRPALVWVSATHLADPPGWLTAFNDLSRAAEARGVAVAVGGQALTESVRRQMRYTFFGDGLGHLAGFARTLRGRPVLSRPARRP